MEQYTVALIIDIFCNHSTLSLHFLEDGNPLITYVRRALSRADLVEIFQKDITGPVRRSWCVRGASGLKITYLLR